MAATPTTFSARLIRRAPVPAAWLAVLCAAAAAPAQFKPERDGLWITVPNPIQSSDVVQIRKKILDAVERQHRKLEVIVFDFNPNGVPSGTGEDMFGACSDLARYIRKLRLGRISDNFPQTVYTVAFVHNEVCKHTVLPVMACAELLMAEDKAKIGDVLRGQAEGLSPEEKAAYDEVARAHRFPELVWHMIDGGPMLRKALTGNLVHYYTDKEIDGRRAKGEPIRVDDQDPLVVETGTTLFPGELARKLKLCREGSFDSKKDVAAALGLPARALREDWQAALTPVVWRIEVSGAINKGTLDSLERRVKYAIKHDANFIFLQLDCSGGETAEVASAANMLRSLTDENGRPLRTVAWIPPNRALGAATFLALGCNEIVMSRSAFLGDFNYLKNEPEPQRQAVETMLLKLAEDQGYQGALQKLLRATLHGERTLYRVRDAKNQYTLFDDDDLKKHPEFKVVNRVPVPEGESLKIDAKLAADWHLVYHNDVETPEDLRGLYGLSGTSVHVSRDDWLDRVAVFFREPVVNLFLIMIGIAALILELKMPGLGIPGVVAAVCFVLFFWAHSFVGQFWMLAVMLFVLGLILIGVEIFVVPGFGVIGVSGILLVVGSLVLVTLERMPQTTQDWVGMGGTLTTFAVGLVAAIGVAFVTARFLPNIPYANRLVLQPPSEAGPETTSREAVGGIPAVSPSLLGAIGTAATPLRPSGKARFGDDFLDVVSEGDYVQPGSRVQVIEIEGNRIVVKAV
jgi:membrane-bound ClpP family serine protease